MVCLYILLLHLIAQNFDTRNFFIYRHLEN
nr:MAG TPA: hypothetical protein [Caudoviricetes sp.]